LQTSNNHIKMESFSENMTSDNDNGNAEAELMFQLLDFARLHGRKITEEQMEQYDEKAQTALKKLIAREYFRKVKKKGPEFYSITSKGLNLFKDKRKRGTVLEDLKEQILEKLRDTIGELGMKPWEVMFHIIHVIGNRQPIPTEGVIQYFEGQFPDLKGTSKPNIYRNLQRLRMKGYIEYAKILFKDQSPYILSEKGKEIFKMTKADAAQKLRTVEEWDTALKKILQRIDEEKKEDEEALFYTLDYSIPQLNGQQLMWVLYTRGNVYELKGALDKAEEAYLRMEGISEEVKDHKGRAYALKGLGNVAFKQGKNAVAEQYYKRCQRIAHHLQDNLLLSDLLNNLGSCSYLDDDVDGALELFEKALELTGDDKSRKASTLYNEGLCYARKEDFAKAKELWFESLSLYKTLQEKTEIKRVQHNLREIDRKEKRDYLEDNYRKVKQMGTTEEIKKAYIALVRFTMDDLKGGG